MRRQYLSCIVQWRPDTIIKILCEVFWASLAFSYIPKAWKNSRVIFISKVGCTNYRNPKAYKTISLSSFFFCNSRDRLVKYHMRNKILIGKTIHQNQHVYHAGRSCETALHHVVSKIEGSFADKKIALRALRESLIIPYMNQLFNLCQGKDLNHQYVSGLSSCCNEVWLR